MFEKPTKQQTLLFSAVNRELKKRANNTLTEEEIKKGEVFSENEVWS